MWYPGNWKVWRICYTNTTHNVTIKNFFVALVLLRKLCNLFQYLFVSVSHWANYLLSKNKKRINESSYALWISRNKINCNRWFSSAVSWAGPTHHLQRSFKQKPSFRRGKRKIPRPSALLVWNLDSLPLERRWNHVHFKAGHVFSQLALVSATVVGATQLTLVC